MKTMYESFLEIQNKLNEIENIKEKSEFDNSISKLLHMDLKLDYDKLFQDLKQVKSFKEKNELLSDLSKYKKSNNYIRNKLDDYYGKIKGL